MKFKLQSLALVAALSLSAQSFAAEYIVKYRSAMGIMSFQPSVQVVDQHEPGQILTVNIPERNKIQGFLSLLSNPNIEYIVPNAKLHKFEAPLDVQALKEQYALKKVNAEQAWAKAGNKGSKKVLIAVIDTGTDSKHKSLAPNMVPGYDWVQNDNDPNDVTSAQNPGHGTHCAGIIGATGLVDQGTMGISPDVSIMPLRFLDQNGSGDLNNSIKAIDYAIEKKVDIISASWGAKIGKQQATPLIEAIARAEKAGIIFVAAAANDGKNNDTTEFYPTNAGLSNVISVAASDADDKKPSWSNYGKAKVSISSPGNAIVSTLPGDKYGNLSGTSMATPLVAGLLGFLKAQDPSLTPAQMKSLIQSTGAKVQIETQCDCRIDALSAVDTMMSKKMFVHPFAGTLAVGEKVSFTGIYGEAPFKFSSSNTAAATISESGELTAVAQGTTTVTVTDSKGVTATSYNINVGASSSNQPPGDGGGDIPGMPDIDCSGEMKPLCDIICQIQPSLPFCSK
jgi:thermitase